MNIRFLSSTLLQTLRDQGESAAPCLAVRMEKCFDGNSGEAMLLLAGERLYRVSRSFCESDYAIRSNPVADVRVVPGGECAAELLCGGERVPCVWSRFEDREAQELFGRCGKPAVEAPAAAVVADSGREPTPGELFVAALMYSAGADGDLPPEQEKRIRELAAPGALAAGVAYYREHEIGECCAAIRRQLSEEARISLLMHQIELAMCDGAFRRVERTLLADFARQCGIDAAGYNEIERLLLLKNQYPTFFGE